MERNETTRSLLSLIHTLYCKKDHLTLCNFYTEIELADCWELPDVTCWTALTTLICNKMHVNEKGLLDALVKVHRVLGDLYRLTPEEQLLFKSILLEADLSVLVLAKSASSEDQTPIDSVLMPAE